MRDRNVRVCRKPEISKQAERIMYLQILAVSPNHRTIGAGHGQRYLSKETTFALPDRVLPAESYQVDGGGADSCALTCALHPITGKTKTARAGDPAMRFT